MNTYIYQIWQIWQIRICFRLLLLALGLTMTTAAQTPAIPLGSYTAVIPQDMRVGNLTFLSGEYQLTLLSGGRFQLGLNDFIGYSGTYTVSGNQVKFAGTTVKVRDSLGVERLAPLFFVSAEQVNYQIPAGTAAGLATITITNDDGIGATGELNITPTAPAIFTATSNGVGAALAVDALTGAPPPFSATQASGQPNIISVFGTGLGADATDLDANINASVQATIGGRAATVQYAGRAPGFIGLNQFNITLPTGLAAGTHTLFVTRGGVTSNSVTIAIK